VVRTKTVSKRTTVLLLRLRYHIITRREGSERALLAEDWQLAAFSGAGESPEWLSELEAEKLLLARPDSNIAADMARTHLERVLQELPWLEIPLGALAKARGEALLESHRRVRRATRAAGTSQQVESKLPIDILGAFVYLPAA
jgi:hypothetical protein